MPMASQLKFGGKICSNFTTLISFRSNWYSAHVLRQKLSMKNKVSSCFVQLKIFICSYIIIFDCCFYVHNYTWLFFYFPKSSEYSCNNNIMIISVCSESQDHHKCDLNNEVIIMMVTEREFSAIGKFQLFKFLCYNCLLEMGNSMYNNMIIVIVITMQTEYDTS